VIRIFHTLALVKQNINCATKTLASGPRNRENLHAMTLGPTETDATTSSAPGSEELRHVARRVFWWLTPEEATADRLRLAAQVMTLGTWDDVQTTRVVLGEETFRRALLNAPSGVFDARSWVYWHRHFRISPIPPLPRREFP